MLSLSGAVALVAVLLVWIVLLSAGWLLVFYADPNSLKSTSEAIPVTGVGRAYFVLYTIFDLGNGDYQPNGSVWQIATILALATGLILISLTVSYLLSVIRAFVDKRSLASQIMGMGTYPAAFVVSAWSGQGFPGLDHQLLIIASQLGTVMASHTAYPILYADHSSKPSQSTYPAIVVLDEALTLFEHAVVEGSRPVPLALAAARAAVTGYLDTLKAARITSSEDTPDLPDLAPLHKAGIPVVDEQEFARRVEGLALRRRLLMGLLDYSGYDWPKAPDAHDS